MLKLWSKTCLKEENRTDEAVVLGGDLFDLGLHLLDVGLFLVGAAFATGNFASAKKVFLDELVKGVEVAALLIGLALGVSVLVVPSVET